ncbi:hypothetical protein K503DRAFT_765070 [Rhizopogon vinicolor AM-OR11-026]|uniref:Uncharacterized protein n=1 Tax=Rhizopogon vinicolor AM-OR11-026 TaxID=1314800 RepID=A0A1B7NI64_9AGAM|nr:hypothetical protein K503DRAFT_765070 [Rhizopogon vinicolor AM-OR11-026]
MPDLSRPPTPSSGQTARAQKDKRRTPSTLAPSGWSPLELPLLPRSIVTLTLETLHN